MWKEPYLNRRESSVAVFTVYPTYTIYQWIFLVVNGRKRFGAGEYLKVPAKTGSNLESYTQVQRISTSQLKMTSSEYHDECQLWFFIFPGGLIFFVFFWAFMTWWREDATDMFFFGCVRGLFFLPKCSFISGSLWRFVKKVIKFHQYRSKQSSEPWGMTVSYPNRRCFTKQVE